MTIPAPRLAAAHRLRDMLTAALSAEIDGALATLNTAEVASAARAGVALVMPPALRFPTSSTEFDADWPVHLVAGPARDYVQAWQTLDQMLEVLLTEGFPITRAEPSAFQPQQGEQLPAYTLTITL